MLKLQNITKTFSGRFKPVLKRVHLELKQGDFCVLVGSNGSGKSTLMKIISGEHEVDEGSIILDGKEVTPHERGHLVSEVTQDVNNGTIPQMTLLENLSLSNDSIKRDEWIIKLKSIGIGLEEYIDEKLSVLSGGQRQLIATLMALNANSTIVLLDEHTSALDPKMQTILMTYTKNAVRELNKTALMITHNLSDAIQYGNRLIMISEGEIVLDVSDQEKSSLTITELLSKSGGFQ